MKTKLLKKVRSEIQIINVYDKNANDTDKKCRVVRVNGKFLIPFLTTKKETFYINYGNAIRRRREEILNLARSYVGKKWWNVFS